MSSNPIDNVSRQLQSLSEQMAQQFVKMDQRFTEINGKIAAIKDRLGMPKQQPKKIPPARTIKAMTPSQIPGRRRKKVPPAPLPKTNPYIQKANGMIKEIERVKKLPSKHPHEESKNAVELSHLYVSLGHCYLSHNDLKQAEQAAKEGLKAVNRIQNHPPHSDSEIQNLRNNLLSELNSCLAWSLLRQFLRIENVNIEPEMIKEAAREGLKAEKNLSNPRDFRLVTFNCVLAQSHIFQKEYVEAEIVARETREIEKNLQDRRFSFILSYLLARSLYFQNKCEESAKIAGQALEMAEQYKIGPTIVKELEEMISKPIGDLPDPLPHPTSILSLLNDVSPPEDLDRKRKLDDEDAPATKDPFSKHRH